VLTDLYGQPADPIPHITLSEWADVALVCPATANVMAKMTAGIADDALTSTLLACACPVLVAPAMNVRMWRNPATQANVETLRSRGVGLIMPTTGELACGDVGEGKLESVENIVVATLGALAAQAAPQDLAGRTILINAGPTREAIDPVRFIANASTGKMGYSIAAEAVRRGARVRLVSGPVSLEPPAGVDVTNVISAAEMLEACLSAFDGADAAICTAAVADYTPKKSADHKLKKTVERVDVIELVETADILAALSAEKGERVVVGFAAETNDVIPYAQAKLARKGCDLIVANDVSRSDSTFGSDTSRIAFVSASGVEELDTLPKSQVAEKIIDRLVGLLEARA
jgi:phosphopantothenoylcysteine decarboxylase/phosphopantothenate--cysteine ligase